MEHEEVVEQLAGAVRTALAYCDPPKEVQPGIYAGVNMPELLSEALIRVGIEWGDEHFLVRHRPGSWEAQHVLALAHWEEPQDTVVNDPDFQ